jgi:hypothetical protein
VDRKYVERNTQLPDVDKIQNYRLPKKMLDYKPTCQCLLGRPGERHSWSLRMCQEVYLVGGGGG